MPAVEQPDRSLRPYQYSDSPEFHDCDGLIMTQFTDYRFILSHFEGFSIRFCNIRINFLEFPRNDLRYVLLFSSLRESYFQWRIVLLAATK